MDKEELHDIIKALVQHAGGRVHLAEFLLAEPKPVRIIDNTDGSQTFTTRR